MTPRTLPDPANDELLEMTGYNWWAYVKAIRQQALTDAIAAVGGLERWQDYLHDGIDIDANGWLIDRAAVIDTLTRLRDGS